MKIEVNGTPSDEVVALLCPKGDLLFKSAGNGGATVINTKGLAYRSFFTWENLLVEPVYTKLYEGDSITITF